MRKIKYLIAAGILMLSAVNSIIAQKTHLLELGDIDSIYSEILNESREIYIQLPDSFNPESNKKYPVVYLLDGDALFNALTTVHSFYWGGFIPEMIIVGISNAENRVRDLTTSRIEKRYGMEFNQENGAAENFTRFIEKELIPYIEANYQATNYRTLIGHSYGGLFTVNVLINHTDLFNNYLAIDPSLDWDDQKLLKQAKEVLKNKNFEGRSLFISLGSQLHMQNSKITIDNVMQDTSEYTLFARSNIEFADIARKSKMNVTWKFYPNDLHGSIPLPSVMDGLITFFDWYTIENTDMFNNPDTPKEELVKLVKYREKKLLDHFGYFVPPFDEEMLNMLGYMNMEWGKTEKSLAFFEFAVEYYPLSANAYDSLADFYVSQNDYPMALKFVTKAYDLNPNEYYKERMDEFKMKKTTNN